MTEKNSKKCKQENNNKCLDNKSAITDLFREQHPALEPENQHRIILSNISDTVLITDDKGKFTYICPNVHFIFGYTENDIENMGNISKLLGKHLFKRSELDKLGEIKNIERKLKDKEGNEHVVLIIVKKVDINNGKVLYTCRDITERKNLERQIVNIAEEERKWVGMEIHDGLLQELSGIQYLLQTLQEQLKNDESKHYKQSERLSKLLNNTIDHAYRLIKGMYPVELEKQGIIPALKDLVENISELYNISIVFRYRINQKSHEKLSFNSIGKDALANLYRITQESINNAIKHSNPDRIVVELIEETDSIVLRIKDNGIPGKGHEAKGFGVGTRSMQYRASLIGATLGVKKLKPAGTEIICKLIIK